MKTYTLRPRLPLRAFVLAAVVSVVGALVAVLAGANGWPAAVFVGGMVLLVAAVLLVGAAVISMRSMRTFVDLDDEGFHIHGPGVDKRGEWAEVTRVALADDGARLVFSHGEVERTHLWCPGGATDPEFQALTRDLVTRLDRSRGYRNVL
ncbi:hypothetical protein ACPCG0_11970 [Propionibacteriaceae bacterium Y1923]|uniref:hypothetical protein n=1 Tax=Aestuariimicrobium sp. Y1814 TaxID=3418742 RepID=UPI003C1A8102